MASSLIVDRAGAILQSMFEPIAKTDCQCCAKVALAARFGHYAGTAGFDIHSRNFELTAVKISGIIFLTSVEEV